MLSESCFFVRNSVTWRYFCNWDGNFPHFFLYSYGILYFPSQCYSESSVHTLHMCRCICRIRSHKQDCWFCVCTFGILAVGKLLSIGTNLLFYPQLSETACSFPQPCSIRTWLSFWTFPLFTFGLYFFYNECGKHLFICLCIPCICFPVNAMLVL